MKHIYHLILCIALSGVALVSLQAQTDGNLRTRDFDDDGRPEEAIIIGVQLEDYDGVQVPFPSSVENGEDHTNDQEWNTGFEAKLRSRELNDTDIRLYPNPAIDKINLKFSSSLLIRVSVLNILGQEVYVQEEQEVQQMSIGVDSFKPGIYFMNLQSGGQRIVKKFKIL